MRILPLINIAVISLCLAACSFDTDDASPTVTETTPEDGAGDVATDAVVTVTFSEALLGETLTTESMTVMLDDEPVPGTLSYDDTLNQLEFVPESPLIKTLEYTVTLDPEITDLARNRLGDYSFSFTVRDGEWGEAAVLSDGAGDAIRPVIASAPDGTAIAAWLQNDGSYNVVNAAHYAPDFGGWGFPGPIDIYELGDARIPRISTGANGDTFVVWVEEDSPGGPAESVYAIRYTVAGGWEAPQLIEESAADANDADEPRIAVDGEGNAIAVWTQADDTAGGRVDVWYNIFSAEDLAWQGETLLESINTGDASTPQVAMNDDGFGLATWSVADGSGVYSVYANRYTPGGGWEASEEIDDDPGNTGNSLSSKPDINGNNQIVVLWSQLNSGNTEATLHARFCDADGNWGDSETLYDGGDIAAGSRVKLSEDGDATTLWYQIQDGNFADVFAARYSSSEWSAPVPLENDPDQSGVFPVLDVDQYGNGLALWWHVDGSVGSPGPDMDVSASRFLGSTGEWDESVSIDNLSTQLANSGGAPGITIAPNGDGIAVWAQVGESGTDLIYTNIFQ